MYVGLAQSRYPSYQQSVAVNRNTSYSAHLDTKVEKLTKLKAALQKPNLSSKVFSG